jgi:transcriptional regulator with XRE-family HTH domain
MTNTEVIAARLKQLRERAGLTQDDVARAAGMGRATYSNIESKRRIDTIRLSHLIKILAFYRLTIHQFSAPNFTENVLVLIREANTSDEEKIA